MRKKSNKKMKRKTKYTSRVYRETKQRAQSLAKSIRKMPGKTAIITKRTSKGKNGVRSGYYIYTYKK